MNLNEIYNTLYMSHTTELSNLSAGILKAIIEKDGTLIENSEEQINEALTLYRPSVGPSDLIESMWEYIDDKELIAFTTETLILGCAKIKNQILISMIVNSKENEWTALPAILTIQENGIMELVCEEGMGDKSVLQGHMFQYFAQHMLTYKHSLPIPTEYGVRLELIKEHV